MARRSDHTRKELKTLVLDEAWNIVKEHGSEGLTARRIAKNIGYAPGTIYNLFDSMDDLCLQLNARTLDLLYDALNDAALPSSQSTSIDNVKSMAQRYITFAEENKPYWLMLFNLQLPERIRRAEWYHEKIERLFTPLEGLLVPYYAPEAEKERKEAARILWASVHGLCFLNETGKISLVSQENKTAAHMTHHLIDTFIAGIESITQQS